MRPGIGEYLRSCVWLVSLNLNLNLCHAVVPAFREPLPGWVDSLNGPIGVLVASGKGVLRSMMCNEKYGAEVIPVDICINLIIAAAHKRIIQ